MSKISVFNKILRFFINLRQYLINYRMFEDRQREQYIEINEIKDWSKGEGYFGNGRLF